MTNEFLVFAIVFGVAQAVVYYVMIVEINQKLPPAERFSLRHKTRSYQYTIFAAHKKLYPHSFLRAVHWSALILALVFLGAGLIKAR